MDEQSPYPLKKASLRVGGATQTLFISSSLLTWTFIRFLLARSSPSSSSSSSSISSSSSCAAAFFLARNARYAKL